MRIDRFVLFAGAAVLAACGRETPMDEALRRDLDAASSGAIELAPAGAATKVVSGIESAPPVQPKVTPARRELPRAKAPPLNAPQATTTAATPERATQSEPAATRPSSTPRVQSCPGGCKSVGEVLRNAPFPIKP
jgi:hypothetical protein